MASFVTEFKHLEIQLEDIISATNNFDESKVIGRGGFGKVYAGELFHSQSGEKSLVAIKRLDRRYGQGDPEFFKEIRMLSCYRHENLISLLGFCCQRDEMILIYEYASRGSLDRYLSSADLTWTERLRICIDAAKGLSFLHDPNGTHQRVLHCDIKSANILLDNNMTAKVSDFGLSKMGPANQQYSLLVTSAVGTIGYCDPLYMQTYSLTKESDVYSFGVVLFEVMCGRLCAENSNGRLNVYVPFWIKCYEENKLDEIILQDLRKKMQQSSLKTFSDIASQCLRNAREERPTMSLVVEKLQIALQMEVLPEEYAKIANAAADPLPCRSFEEFKELLSKGVLLNRGETWLSLNDKEEHHVMVSIEEYLCLDDPNRDYSDRYSSKEKSRFAVGCYKTSLMEFKLRVTAPLFLSPDVTYGLNLVLHASEIEGMKQQYVGVGYKLQGETKISILHFADKKEGKQLVAELYQFKSTEESILDLEIFLEDCGLSGDFYIEGIEFRPLEKMERQVVIANQEIVRGLIPPLFYRFTEEESKVLLSQGVLLNRGKTWLSINNKREICVLISIEDCLIRDKPNGNDSDRFLLKKDSRFPVGFYKTRLMEFKLCVRTPLFLSPDVTYGLNLVFHYNEIENMKQQHVGISYKVQGEKTISIVHFADKEENKLLVAELYQFTSNEERILDLEIFLEDCGLSGDFFIEGIEFRPLENVERQVVIGNQEIVRGLVPPLFYRFTEEESKVLLSQGVLLNRGKKWLCINKKGEHIERIYIQPCLNLDESKAHRLKDPSDLDIVNSRFPGGRCYKYGSDGFTWDGFKARVRGEHLTPQISYTLNLVFLYEDQSAVNSHNPLRYKIDGEAKVFIIYPTYMREDGWFIAPLYHFTTQHSTADLQFEFEERYPGLLVSGIEFHPSEEKVQLPLFEEYQHIVEAASQSLFYTSLDELKQILSKGIYLNGYKTWFSLNEKGQHCHMISMKDCLIPNEDSTPQTYKSHYKSRFPAGLYQTNNKGFKTHVKAQLLSPSITYTVNLVYACFSYGEQVYIDLKYRLRGEATTSVVYLANWRKENLYMAELYQFTSDGSIVDLEINFDDHGTNILGVEGILFQPLEIVEDQLLEDDRVEDIEAISDSDAYWEQKIPNDYEETLKLSKVRLKWKTKKELYSILCKGFLLDNGHQWFFVDKNGKKCQMLSARAARFVIDTNNSNWESSNESRFGEMLVITRSSELEIKVEIKSEVLSPETNYASYLVYKLPQDQSTSEAPLCVWKERVYGSPDWYIYLVSPPHTPVIGPKFDENTYNPLNRYKGTAIRQQRSDGWMEVKVWEFQTTTESVRMHLYFKHPDKKNLKGLIVQGIELRPI